MVIKRIPSKENLKEDAGTNEKLLPCDDKGYSQVSSVLKSYFLKI